MGGGLLLGTHVKTGRKALEIVTKIKHPVLPDNNDLELSTYSIQLATDDMQLYYYNTCRDGVALLETVFDFARSFVYAYFESGLFLYKAIIAGYLSCNKGRKQTKRGVNR